MNKEKWVKSLVVSIVSKSSRHVRLCLQQGKQDLSRDFKNFGRNIVDIRITSHRVFPLDSESKNDTFDFGMTIGYAKKTLTFHYCSHNYQFGEDELIILT